MLVPWRWGANGAVPRPTAFSRQQRTLPRGEAGLEDNTHSKVHKDMSSDMGQCINTYTGTIWL